MPRTRSQVPNAPYSINTHRSPSPNSSTRVLHFGEHRLKEPAITLRGRRPRWQMNGADVTYSFAGTVAVYTAGTGAMYSTTGQGVAQVTAGRVNALSQRDEEPAVRPISCAYGRLGRWHSNCSSGIHNTTVDFVESFHHDELSGGNEQREHANQRWP